MVHLAFTGNVGKHNTTVEKGQSARLRKVEVN